MGNFERYEAGVQPARDRFANARAIRVIASPGIDSRVLEGFFVYFSALGVGMTEPVEGWIASAGARCREIGLDELGNALQGHAKGEAGHHLLMLADLERLCASWNEKGLLQLDPEALKSLPYSSATQRYRQLHEDVIVGPAPFAQLAIEYEIEMLSVNSAPRWLENSTRHLGAEFTEQLSFLVDHVKVDVGHTKFNQRQIAKFLEGRPEAVAMLVEAGSAALDAYRDFLSDCLDRAVGAVALAGTP